MVIQVADSYNIARIPKPRADERLPKVAGLVGDYSSQGNE